MGRRLEDMTEPELADLMDAICRQVRATCAVLGVEKPLYAILLFNDPRVATIYAANCERADVVAAMRECADRLERRRDVTR